MYLNSILKTKKVTIRSGFLWNQFSCILAPDKKYFLWFTLQFYQSGVKERKKALIF